MFDLKRLHVLRVLHQQGTVTAAAAALYLTPSAVSQQIRKLSRDVGVELLERDGRRVRLTPAALTLLSHAETIARQWELARADLATHRDALAGRVRLCGFPTAVASLLTPVADRLRDTHPRVTVEIAEAESAACFNTLLAGESDVAVAVATPDGPPADDPRYDQRVLLDDPLDLVVPDDHPLADRDSVRLAEAAHESWIVPAEGMDHRQVILVACAAAGFAPRIAHQAQEWPAIRTLVAHGHGVCLIPRLAPLPGHRPVVRIRLTGEPAPARRIISCVRRDSDRQPLIATALDALRRLSTDMPSPLLPGTESDPGHAKVRTPHRHARMMASSASP